MTPTDEFKLLRQMCSEVAATSSNAEKQKILATYPDLKNILFYTYHPLQKYYVSSANVLKRRPDYIRSNRGALISRAPYATIYKLLDALHRRKITGTEALDSVLQFIDQFPEYEAEILNIIDKDLKIRVEASTINKVFKKLIPQFKVALANDYWKAKNVDFEKDTWYASRKIDGVRCILIEEGGEPVFYSRQGNKFEVLGVLAEKIKQVENWDTFIFDGEICIVDDEGNENFSSVMKEIRRKNHTIANPRYKIFDVLTRNEFFDIQKGCEFSIRYSVLQQLAEIFAENDLDNYFDVIEQIPVRDTEHLLELSTKAENLGWEGLILRKDVPYEGKRTNSMLKVKKFYDAEYEVLDIETGPFRYILDGAEHEEEMLTAVHIEHKGNPVRVGSGFTIDQRKQFFADPSQIVGKQITVQYFEETTNKQGTTSLRFPVIKHIYDGKRTV